MSPSDDPLDNVSPQTRQRYESALARRRSKERNFQRALPYAVARRVEPASPSARINESSTQMSENAVSAEQVNDDRAPVRADTLPVDQANQGHAWAYEASDAAKHNHGQVWAHWEYSPEEWALFERVDWLPIQRKFWLFAGLSCFLLPDIGLIVWSSTSQHISLLPLGLGFIFIWIPILLMFAISIDIYDEAIKRHRTRRQEKHAHTVTFDSKGLWEAGTYIPLHDLSFVLKKVSLTSRPTTLHFARTYYSGRRTTPHSYPLHVLVPGGHEEEAAQLVQRFVIEVIEAQKQAQQRLMNPPEPI